MTCWSGSSPAGCTLARCCHLVVCLDVFMVGLEDSYVYHSYYCYTCLIMLITLLMLALSKL
jgi:hypothetical protein